MKRLPFVLKFKPGCKEMGLLTLSGLWNEVKRALDAQGVQNFSIWNIQDFLFCYGEYPDELAPSASESAAAEAWGRALSPFMDVFAAQGTSPSVFLNSTLVSAEMVKTLVGSFGLVLVAPFTAFAAAMLSRFRSTAD